MSGRHPWHTLLEGLTPEERTETAREAAKIVADNRRRQARRTVKTPEQPAHAAGNEAAALSAD